MANMADENGVICDSVEYEIVADRHHSLARRVCINRKPLRKPRERIARVEHSLDQPACYLRLAAILRNAFIDCIQVALSPTCIGDAIPHRRPKCLRNA